MKPDSDVIYQLITLANSNPQVQVLWLYGSRAKGIAGPAQLNSGGNTRFGKAADINFRGPKNHICSESRNIHVQ